MGGRGGEEKGKRELGCRGSGGFVLEFLRGTVLQWGVQRVLPLGLFSGFWGKVQSWGDDWVLWCASNKLVLRGQACCDKVSAGPCPSTGAASPIPHPPAKCEPPFLPPFLTFGPVGTQKLV